MINLGIKQLKSNGFFLFFAAVVLVFTASPSVYGQKNCSKSGSASTVKFFNGTSKQIEVRWVSYDCKERSGSAISPGKSASDKSYANNVYRVYEYGTNNLLKEIVVEPSNPTYAIGAVADKDPRQSFIKTLNQIRSGVNLPALKLDSKLNQTCQWWTDFMSSQDKGRSGHKVSEFTNDKTSNFNNAVIGNMETPEARLIHFKWDKNKTFNAEATGLVYTPDINTIGGRILLDWTTSNTHFRPFYDQQPNVKFTHVGFGYTKQKAGNYYYGCAIFANP